MHQQRPGRRVSRAQLLTKFAFAKVERFFHIEAVSGIVLLIAALIALIWANSPFAESYHHLWHTPLSIGFGQSLFSESLHFWINDVLMTLFFLVVGMEIRREIHEGALSSLKQAALPFAAALGGVAIPALIYLALNTDPARQQGWAIPTATDIAFAVGVLALLGRSIPSNVRIFLLALAVIDDIIAVLIIALFYSGGLDYSGFALAGIGIASVILLQRMGIGSAYAYVLPGAIIWIGLFITGAHPSLAGVVLGLMTPVLSSRVRRRPLALISRVHRQLLKEASSDHQQLAQPLRRLRIAQRELLPPVTRIEMALHPWVAFGIMPLFALANAGVSLQGADLYQDGAQWVMFGIAIALIFGKPIGVISVSWLMVRLGWCRLPAGVTWSGVCLIGVLAGIGFTMSIFVSMLAFQDDGLLSAAKLGVLSGSLVAAVLGLVIGGFYIQSHRRISSSID